MRSYQSPKPLFISEATFISSAETAIKALTEVANSLIEKNFVSREFKTALLSREEKFPTGLKLSPLGENLPNVAFPHTDGDFVKKRLIVPVKLTNPLAFNNMIQPQETIDVGYLFILLNNDPKQQVNLLAAIMEFLRTTPNKQLTEFFNLNDPILITEFLQDHFSNILITK